MDPGPSTNPGPITTADEYMIRVPLARDMTSREIHQANWGTFIQEEAAARSFDNAAIIIRGSKAKLNFPIQEYLDERGVFNIDPVIDCKMKVIDCKMKRAHDPNRKLRAEPNFWKAKEPLDMAALDTGPRAHDPNRKLRAKPNFWKAKEPLDMAALDTGPMCDETKKPSGDGEGEGGTPGTYSSGSDSHVSQQQGAQADAGNTPQEIDTSQLQGAQADAGNTPQKIDTRWDRRQFVFDFYLLSWQSAAGRSSRRRKLSSEDRNQGAQADAGNTPQKKETRLTPVPFQAASTSGFPVDLPINPHTGVANIRPVKPASDKAEAATRSPLNPSTSHAAAPSMPPPLPPLPHNPLANTGGLPSDPHRNDGVYKVGLWREGNLLGRMTGKSREDARHTLDNMMDFGSSFHHSEANKRQKLEVRPGSGDPPPREDARHAPSSMNHFPAPWMFDQPPHQQQQLQSYMPMGPYTNPPGQGPSGQQQPQQGSSRNTNSPPLVTPLMFQQQQQHQQQQHQQSNPNPNGCSPLISPLMYQQQQQQEQQRIGNNGFAPLATPLMYQQQQQEQHPMMQVSHYDDGHQQMYALPSNPGLLHHHALHPPPEQHPLNSHQMNAAPGELPNPGHIFYNHPALPPRNTPPAAPVISPRPENPHGPLPPPNSTPGTPLPSFKHPSRLGNEPAGGPVIQAGGASPKQAGAPYFGSPPFNPSMYQTTAPGGLREGRAELAGGLHVQSGLGTAPKSLLGGPGTASAFTGLTPQGRGASGGPQGGGGGGGGGDNKTAAATALQELRQDLPAMGHKPSLNPNTTKSGPGTLPHAGALISGREGGPGAGGGGPGAGGGSSGAGGLGPGARELGNEPTQGGHGYTSSQGNSKPAEKPLPAASENRSCGEGNGIGELRRPRASREAVEALKALKTLDVRLMVQWGELQLVTATSLSPTDPAGDRHLRD
eukprot:gene30086-35048_t